MVYGSDQLGSDARFGNDGLTEVLLHFDGALVDSSKNHFTPSFLGTGALSTAQSKFGGSSLRPGTGGASVPDNASLELGTSDFTIEIWAYIDTASIGNVIFCKDNSTGLYPIIAGGYNPPLYNITSDNATYNIANGVSMGTTLSLNTWHHIALVRSGNTFTPYVNGIAGTTSTSSLAVFNSTSAWSIGSNTSLLAVWPGYLDEFRISVGIARWTANFTPPPMPYGL